MLADQIRRAKRNPPVPQSAKTAAPASFNPPAIPGREATVGTPRPADQPDKPVSKTE